MGLPKEIMDTIPEEDRHLYRERGEAIRGNRFWMNRFKHGRNVKYSPKSLQAAACKYFEWCEDNPLYQTHLVSYKGGSEICKIPKMRAMTLSGLRIWLGISETTWYSYADNDKYKDICQAIMDVMYDQKFTGAAADLLNANIISKELGLADKKEMTAEIKGSGIKWIGDDESD